MPRNLVSCVLLVMSLVACATLPKLNPKVEAKLQEADTALDSLSANLTAFYGNLEPLLQEIKALYDQPGWIDMETIIASTLREAESEEELPAGLELKNALNDWTAKWGDSGEDLYHRYLSLVDRCSISEARRIGLIGRLASLQAMYLEATFLELAANRYDQAKAIYGTVEALSKSEDELNSYTLNAVGLYDVKLSRSADTGGKPGIRVSG